MVGVALEPPAGLRRGAPRERRASTSATQSGYSSSRRQTKRRSQPGATPGRSVREGSRTPSRAPISRSSENAAPSNPRVVAQEDRRDHASRQRGRNAVGPGRVRDHDRAGALGISTSNGVRSSALLVAGRLRGPGGPRACRDARGRGPGSASRIRRSPASGGPSRKSPAASMIRAGSAEARARRSTSPPAPGTHRSTTGARSTSKPRRAQRLAPRARPPAARAPARSPPRSEGTGAEQVAQAVDGAALLVEEQEARAEVPELGDQARELRLALDVAPEEDHAARRMRRRGSRARAAESDRRPRRRRRRGARSRALFSRS